MAAYVPAVRIGHLLYTSGAGPFAGGRPAVVGRVGETLTLEEGSRQHGS